MALFDAGAGRRSLIIFWFLVRHFQSGLAHVSDGSGQLDRGFLLRELAQVAGTLARLPLGLLDLSYLGLLLRLKLLDGFLPLLLELVGEVDSRLLDELVEKNLCVLVLGLFGEYLHELALLLGPGAVGLVLNFLQLLVARLRVGQTLEQGRVEDLGPDVAERGDAVVVALGQVENVTALEDK